MKITINKPTDFEAKFLKVDAGVRYWDDGYINDVEDCDSINGSPKMPCAEFVEEQYRILRGGKWRWRPLIDIEAGQIVNWEQGITAHLHYKVCDDFQCEILDADKNVITSYEGYVPKVMCPADEGFGDYIIMDIDENGFIQGWRKDLISRIIEEQED